MRKNADRARYERLRALFRAAPLPAAEYDELRTLARRFDPKMAGWMDENAGTCS